MIPNQNTISILYITLSSQSKAEMLAEQAVAAKQATCVNIIPQAVSIYAWEGKIEKSQECLLIFKTSGVKEESLRQWIIDHHPYAVPAILHASVHTSKDFLSYIEGHLS